MLTVYGDIHSGNCYKVKLLLEALRLPHAWRHVDILRGESRKPDFLAMNPNGRIPLLVLADGRRLAESNAILHYLANGTDYLPAERFAQAEVLQWMFFEQYSHEPYIATSRYIVRYLGNPPERQGDLDARRAGGYAALGVMEHHLAARSYFVGERYSIADIALYAYTHVAHEGGFALDDFRHVRAWIARIGAQTGHLTMTQFAVAADRSS